MSVPTYTGIKRYGFSEIFNYGPKYAEIRKFFMFLRSRECNRGALKLTSGDPLLGGPCVGCSSDFKTDLMGPYAEGGAHVEGIAGTLKLTSGALRRGGHVEVVAGTLKLTSGDPLLEGTCGGYSWDYKTDFRGPFAGGDLWRV